MSTCLTNTTKFSCAILFAVKHRRQPKVQRDFLKRVRTQMARNVCLGAAAAKSSACARLRWQWWTNNIIPHFPPAWKLSALCRVAWVGGCFRWDACSVDTLSSTMIITFSSSPDCLYALRVSCDMSMSLKYTLNIVPLKLSLTFNQPLECCTQKIKMIKYLNHQNIDIYHKCMNWFQS